MEQDGHLVIYRSGPGQIIKGQLVSTEGVKMRVRILDNEQVKKDEEEETTEKEINLNQVLLQLPMTTTGIGYASQPLLLKTLLRGLWGNLVFGRVSRIIARAQDLNIWYNPDPLLVGTRPRQYLGDNKEVLKKFTREEIRYNISFEYDFYFGFCAPLNNSAASSFHFSSSNFSEPRLFAPVCTDNTGIFDSNIYSVIPPKMGDLICGRPVESKRGISLFQWWVCPEAFYELWKLIQSDRVYDANYSTYMDMQRLKLPFAPFGASGAYGAYGPSGSKLFQEIAMCAIFNRHSATTVAANLSNQCRTFFTTLQKWAE